MGSLKFGTIRQGLVFAATPEELYEIFLDARQHSGSPATTSARVGAKSTAWYISGKNLELVKGRKIVQEWRTTMTEWPEGYTPIAPGDHAQSKESGGRAQDGAVEGG